MSDAMMAAIGAIIVALIALAGNIYAAKKGAEKAEKAANAAADRVGTLTIYRIDQLEKKVDKHNTLIDRMYCAEKRLDVQSEQIKVANHRLEDLEDTERKGVQI